MYETNYSSIRRIPDLPYSFFSNSLAIYVRYGWRASCSKQARLIELLEINGSAEVSVKCMATGVETTNSVSRDVMKKSCSKRLLIVLLPEKISSSRFMRAGEKSLVCVSTCYSSTTVAWNKSIPNISCNMSIPIE